MTEQEFIAAVEATGATEVWVIHKPVDMLGAGVGVSFRRGKKQLRNAVRLSPDEPQSSAYETLLDWAANWQPRWAT